MKRLILILALLIPVSVYAFGLMMSSGTVVTVAGGVTTVNIGNNTGDSGGIDDNRLDTNATDNNYGVHPRGYTGPSGTRTMREIQRWDLSGISNSETASAAKLWLYDTDWANRIADLTITIYEIASANGDWVEGTANGSAENGSPSWDWKIYNTAAWAGTGGLSTAGTDYINTSLGSASFIDGVSGYRSIALNADGLTAVSSWFGTTAGNPGVVLVGTGSSGSWTEWHSRQGTDTQRPYLELTY